MATGYGQYCPISRALEVLGERWSLLIVRDMLVGTTRFNDLSRGLPALSRSLLSKRLRQPGRYVQQDERQQREIGLGHHRGSRERATGEFKSTQWAGWTR